MDDAEFIPVKILPPLLLSHFSPLIWKSKQCVEKLWKKLQSDHSLKVSSFLEKEMMLCSQGFFFSSFFSLFFFLFSSSPSFLLSSFFFLLSLPFFFLLSSSPSFLLSSSSFTHSFTFFYFKMGSFFNRVNLFKACQEGCSCC